MADEEIDIVEHDLLDNPLVRKMFPDLSILKNEAIDFNDEVSENLPTKINVIEQTSNYDDIIKRDTYMSLFSCNLYNEELYQGDTCNKGTLCSDVKTKSHIVDKRCTAKEIIKDNKNSSISVNVLNSKLIEEKLKSTNLYKQKINGSNIKLNSSRLPKTLKKTSVFLKSRQYQNRKISQQLSLQKENSSTMSPLCTVKQSNNIEHNQLDHRKIYEKSKGNKIIIGSKPVRVKQGEIKNVEKLNIVRNVKVTLENINTFLCKSSRYCKICFRLFPSNKNLTDHQNRTHAQTHDNKACELVKNKSINHYECKCNICHVVCSSPSDLLRHKRVIHPTNNRNITKPTQCHKPNSRNKLNLENKKFKCTHCNCSYTSQQLLIDHMYDVLQTNKKNVSESTETKKRKNVDKCTSTKIFYRCSFCSYYFQKQNIYIKHMKDKHKKIGTIKLEKVAFDSLCKHCFNKYRNVKSFNSHVTKYHQKVFTIRNDRLDVSIIRDKNVAKKSKSKEQMIKLKENKPNNAPSTLNNEQCTLNMDEKDVKNVKIISTVTNSEIRKPKSLYFLKSALFKCIKCDICFLSGIKATDHEKHKDRLINWKCLKCSKIFKKEDEFLHTQQHLHTDTFDVYEVKDIPYSLVLYKCPNCTTFFRENDFFSHYSTCETQSPDSAYCKTCHILIDSKIKDLHDIHHKEKTEYMELNNIFVESDVITYNEEKKIRIGNFQENIVLKQENSFKKNIIINEQSSDLYIFSKLEKKGNKFTKKIPIFTYCSTCRCFERKTQNRFYHTNGRCSHLIKYVCRYCGLILSNKTINFHRKLHRDVPGLTINDFKFYDMKSGKVISPPVPKYPNCYKCGKHFITKTAIISHQCSEDYLTCPVCKIKLSNTAYPLHMSFHNYLPKSETFSISNTDDNDDGELTNKDLPLESKVPISLSNKKEENNQLLVYVCKSCKLALDTYDKVIEHCQDHVSSQDKEVKTKACDACNLLFDVMCLDNHKLLHTSNHEKEIPILTFDVFYATAENNLWLNHLFGSLPKEAINNILRNSIYKFERRVKMKILQDGLSYFTLYKCAKCKKMIDASSIYKHCQIDILCSISRAVECSHCGIFLVSDESRIEHEKIHQQQDFTLKSCRIVLFNSDEDKFINHALSLPNKYVLYECRNCNGIVNKMQFKNHKCDYDDLAKCSYCGLLLCTNDYMPHVLKHKEFCSYKENNMKVILIGLFRDSDKLKQRMFPSFRGIRLDYLMYECTKCQVCVKDKESSLIHECALDISKTKCLTCGLYIDDSKFKNHRKFHENNLHYLKENITIVKFGFTEPKPSSDDIIVIEDDGDLENISNNSLESDKFDKNCDSKSELVIEKSNELFKCSCGLHFLNKEMALSHNMSCDYSSPLKQMCSKCGLTFTPTVLYNHLLAHHRTRNIGYKFNVIEIP